MARMFAIDLRALVPLAIPDLNSHDAALSNKNLAGYIWETLSYFGCTERVEEIIRRTAEEEGFDALTFDAFIRRIERALDEAGFEVAKKNVHGRARYADAQVGRYTDMKINVFDSGGANGVTVFDAHKCVVSSASPLLKAMIERRSAIGPAGTDEAYEIREIPAEVFRICMEFMYTDEVRRDVPMSPDLIAGVVLAADRMLITAGLLPLLGRELLTETNAPRAIQAAYMTHATEDTRVLVGACAIHIARSLGTEPTIAVPMMDAGAAAALYAIAGEVVNALAARPTESERDAIDKRRMSAVLAWTGREPHELHAHLIANGTPPNMHTDSYRVTLPRIDTKDAPLQYGRIKTGIVVDDGKHTFVFSIGQWEYAACVRKSTGRSKTPTTPGSARKVRVTVALRSREARSVQAGPQLVTIRAAGISTHAVLAYGYEHTLTVPSTELDEGGIMSVEVEADPLFAVASEAIRLAVQHGEAIATLDTSVIEWILRTKSPRGSYAAILREIATRYSEDDRLTLTSALIAGFGVGGLSVSTSEMTGLLRDAPPLFEPRNKGMLDLLVNYAIGAEEPDRDRAPLMGLIDCIAQGIRTASE